MDWLVHGLYLVLIGIGAGFVQRVSGFGLGIFAMMFLPYFTPTPVAATISTLFSCVESIISTSSGVRATGLESGPTKPVTPRVLVT